MAKKKNLPASSLGMTGFYRVNIVDPDARVAGDSGWKKNLIPLDGMMKYVAYRFVNSAGSYICPSYMNLGSLQSTLATNATSLPGEMNKSLAASFGATANVTTGYPSMTNRFTATFVSNSMMATTGNSTIGCIGLYAYTTANSIMCGGSFASSTLGSNQAINCTYDIVWTASTS